jgi:hypothetical protein
MKTLTPMWRIYLALKGKHYKLLGGVEANSSRQGCAGHLEGFLGNGRRPPDLPRQSCCCHLTLS